MSALQKNLLDGATANGNGTPIRWRGGKGRFWLLGTMGGASAKIQWSLDDDQTGSWFDAKADGTAQSLSAAGNVETTELPNGWLRAVVSGATGTTDLDSGIVSLS